MNAVNDRIKLERKIVKAFVTDAIADGCTISVFDGEEFALKRSSSVKDIMEAIMSTDDDQLRVRKNGEIIGFVHLVYGNCGHDVISDYTTSLEYLMKSADEIALKAERNQAW